MLRPRIPVSVAVVVLLLGVTLARGHAFHNSPIRLVDEDDTNSTVAAPPAHSTPDTAAVAAAPPLPPSRYIAPASRSLYYVNLTNFKNTAYFGTLSIGVPEQTFKVLYSTGSADTWLYSAPWRVAQLARTKERIAEHRRQREAYARAHPPGGSDVTDMDEALPPPEEDDIIPTYGNLGYNRTRSESYVRTVPPHSFTIVYGSGKLKAVSARELMRIGGLDCVDMDFGEIVQQTTAFDEKNAFLAWDGVVGLSYIASSADTTKQQIPVFDSMIKRGWLSASVFSLFLTNTADSDGSTLVLGGTDSRFYRDGDTISFFPVTFPFTFWMLNVSAITLSGGGDSAAASPAAATTEDSFIQLDATPDADSDSESESESGSRSGGANNADAASAAATAALGEVFFTICDPASAVSCHAVFDSGSSLISGPSRLISKLLKHIKPEPNCANLHELPDLSFHFNFHPFTLTPTDYVIQIPIGDSGESACMLGITALDLPHSMGDLWVLGTVFLRRFYTVFDREYNRIGLVVANQNWQRPTPVPPTPHPHLRSRAHATPASQTPIRRKRNDLRSRLKQRGLSGPQKPVRRRKPARA